MKLMKQDPKDQQDDYEQTKDDLDNHANQLNPNNDTYWESRGEEERPVNWEEKSDE